MSRPWLEWLVALANGVDQPSCHVYFTADQATADEIETDLLWSAEDHDNAAMHNTSTNTDRITIPSNGIYCVGAHVNWIASALGHRGLKITLNDPAPPAASAILIRDNPLAASFNDNAPKNKAVVTREFSDGDVLRVCVVQDSGLEGLDTEGTTTGGPYSNGFWCFKVSN